MGQIFDTLRAHLDGRGINYDLVGEHTALRFGYATERLRWVCVGEAREEQHLLILVGILPVRAPAARRAEVAALLMHLNFELPVGNFEIDFADGQIRFRTSIDVEGTELVDALVRQLLNANLATVARHAELIIEVAGGAPVAGVAGIGVT